MIKLKTILLEKGKGMWANIHAKRKRGEAPAKKGDDSYPDKKEWDKNTNEEVLQEGETYSDYPASAKNNAKKAIAWKEKYGRDEVTAATRVGWARAHQLASGEALSAETVKRMSAFNRHRKNSKIDSKYKATPWKDNGYVAWLTWGGDSGVNWAMAKSKKIQKND